MDQRLQKVLSECMLFRGMSAQELSALLDCLDFRVRKFGRNETVNTAGDPFEGLGVILTGQADVIKENSTGDRMIMTILKPGDIFGEMAAFSGVGKWPATVVAHTDCSVMYVPPDKLTGQCEKACAGHRRLVINMLGILSWKALTLSKKLEYLSVRSVRGRIAKFLLEQYKNYGQTTFLIPMNRNEMADFLNITRPSLSREMSRMKDDGILDFHRSSVRIMDMRALKEAAE